MTTARDIIDALKLEPHPEGGYYIQTFADPEGVDGRPHSTAIYYLLEGGDRSHWHRVDAVEVWLYHAGAPLELRLSDDGIESRAITLGPNILAGERPQGLVRKNEWQSARSLGDWTLVSCTVAPGFRFEGFEMAAPDWEPGRA
ncbi:cupin domain-containing protein [Rhizobium alvei]|uniref:Cupin domain-containing protein n=1 Tax=Rhizobium alvei TaxID=1132659 RepID=A0ABT8YI88_9HYPH|nr:cupin domain-containing protein [Rhizobium alvei]MDO6963341.1 cupin domain-containing protein [Rhizobium alvei]